MTGPNETRDAIERAKAEVERQAERFVVMLALELYRRIVLKTPVDTGRARMNWNIGVGSPDPSTSDWEGQRKGEKKGEFNARLSAGGVVAMSKGFMVLATFKLGQVVYITNNLPYIRVLEFGEYPNPPKHGSWVKGKGWVIKSVNGFSRQAPTGMVGVTIAELNQIIPVAQGMMHLTVRA